MPAADTRSRQSGTDAQLDPTRPDAVAHAGTFNNNALTMTAGLTAITEVFTPAVAEALNAGGHTVVALDQRGHGRSDAPDTGYDLDTAVADLLAAMAALGLDRPVVAGQSWGGNVALELGWRRP